MRRIIIAAYLLALCAFWDVQAYGSTDNLRSLTSSPAPVPVRRIRVLKPGESQPVVPPPSAEKQPQPQDALEAIERAEIDARFRDFDEALQLEAAHKKEAQAVEASADLPVSEKEDIDARFEAIISGRQAKLAPAKTEKQPKPVKTSAKPQPRLEVFTPDSSQPSHAKQYSGTVKGIRWTSSAGSNPKVKAVVEADDGAEPQVYFANGSIHALFADCADKAEGLSSPYANIKVEVHRNAEGAELVFTPSGFMRAEKLVLNSPRRIALDFFLANDTTPQPHRVTPSRPKPQIPQAPVSSQTRPRSSAVTALPSTLTIPRVPPADGRKTVVIDPGHGGKDPGASGNGVTEKYINLAVGLELAKILTARGYRVVMTRQSDVYLTLQERTDIANAQNADVFVSVHVNALPSRRSMTGFEIYIMALPTDKDALELAKVENREYVEDKGMSVTNVDRRTEMLLKILGDMQQNNKISESTDFAAVLYNAGVLSSLPMRRIAQAPFFVLRGAGMPAVLLEVGFLTNTAEAQMLTNPTYQQRIANAMATGIANYLK